MNSEQSHPRKPILLRVLPDRLKQSLVCRHYNRLPDHLTPLLSNVRLKYAKGARMPHVLSTDLISSRLALTGFYELKLTRIVRDLARRGGRMIDVGANQGYFTLLWLANNRGNTCLAVEASPRNVEMLRGNVAANNFISVCKVIEVAAGATRSTMSFDLGPAEQTGWGGLSLTVPKESAIQVDVVPLDELVCDDEAVHVLKIDVEGADTWVLEGASRLLKRKQIRNVFFEQNIERMKRLDIAPGRAQQLLELCGYRIRALSASSDEFWAVPNT